MNAKVVQIGFRNIPISLANQVLRKFKFSTFNFKRTQFNFIIFFIFVPNNSSYPCVIMYCLKIKIKSCQTLTLDVSSLKQKYILHEYMKQ